MKRIESTPVTLTDLDIKVDISELTKKIQTGSQRPDIITIAEETLALVSNSWAPAIIYNWFPYISDKEGGSGHVLDSNGSKVVFNLGHSSQFLDNASYVLVAAYTAGIELEEAGQVAMKSGQPLIAYIIDLIGLLVLEKTGDIVKQIAEQNAKEFDWGVSPFLSPGSIHGWELEEQLKLCQLLPLENANLSIESNSILHPYKSISCLIGIGPDFTSTSVGLTCLVCSKNSDCQMKQS